MHRTALQAILAAGITSAAFAQFSADPANPLVLASGSGEQVQPKVAVIPSGGFYLSWYDGGNGYDAWVQRFDETGTPMWPNGGVRVLDTNFSSTEDYGLTIDAAGNAVVVTRRDAPSVAIVAQAVSPAGNLLWGATGVVAPGWAATATVTDSTATTILSDLQPGDGQSVIASVVRYTTFTGAKTLQAQKFSATGTALWVSTNVRVFATGSLQFGNFPPFISDGEGGAILSWYTSSPLMARVQWVAPNGTLRFGTNGAAVTTDTTHNAVNPAVCYDPALRQVYVGWPSQIPNSSIYGYNAQAFGESGNALWGSTGSVIAPDQTVYSIALSCAAMLDGMPVFGYSRSTAFGADTLQAQRMSSAGVPQWSAPIAVAGEFSLSRPGFAAMTGNGSPWVLAFFQQGATGVADVAAARINADGSLGTPATVCGDLDGSGSTTGADLGVMLAQWGICGGCSGDLNQDGEVNGADLGILLACWSSN